MILVERISDSGVLFLPCVVAQDGWIAVRYCDGE
jgi:hypothetical protein